MSRTLRTLIVAAAIVVVIGALAYAAMAFDLAGMIVRMHVPPAH